MALDSKSTPAPAQPHQRTIRPKKMYSYHVPALYSDHILCCIQSDRCYRYPPATRPLRCLQSWCMVFSRIEPRDTRPTLLYIHQKTDQGNIPHRTQNRSNTFARHSATTHGCADHQVNLISPQKVLNLLTSRKLRQWYASVRAVRPVAISLWYETHFLVHFGLPGLITIHQAQVRLLKRHFLTAHSILDNMFGTLFLV